MIGSGGHVADVEAYTGTTINSPVDTITGGGIIWFELYGIFLLALGGTLGKIRQRINPPSIVTWLRRLSILSGLGYCLLPLAAYISLINIGLNLFAAYVYLFTNIFAGLLMLGLLYTLMTKVR